MGEGSAMSTILYEWEFANYLCRVVESESGIVHFEQARKESDGDPRVMEFQHTATPMGAANEIIQLHQALAEAKMLNRDLSAFCQGYQEDRNRRERELADAMEERDEAIKAKNGLVAIVECREERIKELMGNSVHADVALDAEGYKRKCEQLRADLEAARVQYNELLYAVEQREPGKSRHGTALDLIRRGQRSDNEAAKENPAVRAAREGR